MKTRFTLLRRLGLAGLIALAVPVGLDAYPPAPHHTIYGMVRDQWGTPLNIIGSEVFLETEGSDALRTTMTPGVLPGVNYQLEVPMDSGTSPDLYTPTAMQPLLPFRLKVRIGGVTYLPIEMSGSFAQIGEPGGSTRIDLTLGEDSDGDGLPDAWEQELINALGGGLTQEDVLPGDDADGDGLSNLDEYRAGTYAFDPEDGFMLSLVANAPGVASLEFLAIQGRNYTIEASINLEEWTPVSFRTEPQGALLNNHQANDSRVLRIDVPSVEGSETNLYYRALVQ